MQRELWRSRCRERCGGEDSERAVEENMQREMWKRIYRERCGGEYAERDVEEKNIMNNIIIIFPIFYIQDGKHNIRLF